MPSEPRRDYGTIVFAALFVLLGLWVLWQSVGMSPLGAVFPRTIAIAMVVFSAALIGMHLWRAPAPQTEEPKQPESHLRRAGLVGVMLLWVFSIPIIGFAVTSLIAFLLIIVIANYDPWTPRQGTLYALSALLVVAGFYLLFGYALNVPMPTGILF